MTGTDELSHEELLRRLQALAERAIKRFGLPDGAPVKLINVSENATYKVEDGTGRKWALRVHREGYHSRTAIASELAWLAALRESGGVATPTAVRGLDGEYIQAVAGEGLPNPRNVVLFDWEDGAEPEQTNVAGFELLGETAAHMHAHVRKWQRPVWFERHSWDFETSLGNRPHWGYWKDGMGMTAEALEAFSETVALIAQRLEAFGKSPDRFNLVHGDMRLANLLMDGSTVKVIDFDDSGFSWLLYDCATTVSFFEHTPEVPELLNAWVRGYRRIGTLSPEEENEIATFVMLRRLLLVAWIGSHSETELAQSMGVSYTQGSIPLCETYLSRYGRPTSSSIAVSSPKKGILSRLFG
ncbi:phosphotransferase enzyme family protein [Hyphomicrobium sp.]|jgi:Ser/Thr protein kinase RdoA (MazF antagonist)|uniref:phosphotransferase enzyme family protein n=1 Tax=Hyphomicrobium sp. TaxID=82 RepID=UPI003561F90B